MQGPRFNISPAINRYVLKINFKTGGSDAGLFWGIQKRILQMEFLGTLGEFHKPEEKSTVFSRVSIYFEPCSRLHRISF